MLFNPESCWTNEQGMGQAPSWRDTTGRKITFPTFSICSFSSRRSDRWLLKEKLFWSNFKVNETNTRFFYWCYFLNLKEARGISPTWCVCSSENKDISPQYESLARIKASTVWNCGAQLLIEQHCKAAARARLKEEPAPCSGPRTAPALLSQKDLSLSHSLPFELVGRRPRIAGADASKLLTPTSFTIKNSKEKQAGKPL